MESFKLKDVTDLADRAYSTYKIIKIKCEWRYYLYSYKNEYEVKGEKKIERFFKSLKDKRRIATRQIG